MREAIWRAMYDQLVCQSIDDIRVCDIVMQAAVGRTTFYRLFRSKYDVVNWRFGLIYNRFFRFGPHRSIFDKRTLTCLLKEFQRNREVVLHAFSSDDSRGLKAFTVRYFSEMIHRERMHQFWSCGPEVLMKNPDVSNEFVAYILALGVTDYLIEWVKEPSVEVDRAASAIVAVLPHGISG